MDTHDLTVVTQRRREHVDAVLDRFFGLAKTRASGIGPRYVTLWETLEKNTAGGKRFRPSMVLAAYESLGGADSETAAYVGAAFELLHTALIVHDDVIDRDFIRAGRPQCLRKLPRPREDRRHTHSYGRAPRHVRRRHRR